MDLRDVRDKIEAKLNEITFNISESVENDIIYNKICEVLKNINIFSNSSFNIDIVNISDKVKLDETEEEAYKRKQAKAKSLDSFLKERTEKDKVNIFFVFGASNVASSPHSNLLIAVGDELYSVDSSPMSNSVPNMLKGLGYSKIFANGIYYNDKKNRDSCTGLQVANSTCVKKSLLTITNILEIFKDFDISGSKDSLQSFFKDGLLEYAGEILGDTSSKVCFNESEEERFNKKFFYNPLYSILESDLFDELAERAKKYLNEEKRILDESKSLEKLLETVSKFPEFNYESVDYLEVIDSKLKKNYSTRLSKDLEFASEVNKRLMSMIDGRQLYEDTSECSVAYEVPGDFFDNLLDDVDLNLLGKAIPEEKFSMTKPNFGELTSKTVREFRGGFCQ